MTYLLPCAHCGSTDIDEGDCSTMETNGTRIACNGCGVMVAGYGGSTCTARAIAKWNTRAPNADLAQAKADLARADKAFSSQYDDLKEAVRLLREVNELERFETVGSDLLEDIEVYLARVGKV